MHASIDASYYFQDPDNGYGVKTSEDNMRKRATYIGWAFLGDDGLSADDAVWTIDEGEHFRSSSGIRTRQSDANRV